MREVRKWIPFNPRSGLTVTENHLPLRAMALMILGAREHAEKKTKKGKNKIRLQGCSERHRVRCERRCDEQKASAK